MGKNLLVRDLPEDVREWIDEQRSEYMMSQQEFVVRVLRKASESKQPYLIPFMPDAESVNKNGHRHFNFIDLFAGIGGFRIALQKLGGTCVFSCEWDKYAQRTYKNWFGETPHGDIRELNIEEIPDHHVLAAGFPCQPFSIAGVSKKNSLGQSHGFSDLKQGNLFFNLATIVELKRPPVLFLENVKNLKSHDKGRTWQVIQDTLDEMDYWVFHKIFNAADWVPQHRQRIYIVCFDKKVYKDKPKFVFPSPPSGEKPKLKDILEKSPDKKYTLTDHLWNYLQEYAKKHKAKGNGFGYGLADLAGVSRTLSARYHKDGSEILIPQSGKNPRRLTPGECARLMGFPENLPIVVSDTQAYRQFGNAVVPLIVEAIGENIIEFLPHLNPATKGGNF